MLPKSRAFSWFSDSWSWCVPALAVVLEEFCSHSDQEGDAVKITLIGERKV